jgi:Ca2+-binding RTX toxin-like protein
VITLRTPVYVLVVVALTAGFAGGVVFSGANVIPTTSAVYSSQIQAVNDIKPAECTGILTGIVSGAGAISGTAAAELILGSDGVDTINAGDGDDCILGGGGADVLNGEGGDDVIFGGPGIDVCTGGAGADSFPNGECETANP